MILIAKNQLSLIDITKIIIRHFTLNNSHNILLNINFKIDLLIKNGCHFRLEAQKQTPGIADIRQKALNSGGQERLGPQSKALVSVGGTKQQSSTALVQRRIQSMPKPQWHSPWTLMRVGTGRCLFVLCACVICARLAQLVRSLTANQEVPGSSLGLVEG